MGERVPREKAEEYEKFLIERVGPDYSSVEGLKNMYSRRRNEEKVVHFLPLIIKVIS
ncbi:hypothetical protein P8X24_08805 [Pyrococcus kukulkanii]|uniref:hypothetical protein n=1 Tax=Pyrococcus kukulkanii TaxID=1609559 RepID=UPI003566ECBF